MRVNYTDANKLAARFYFKNKSDVVPCAFCGVEIGYWEKT